MTIPVMRPWLGAEEEAAAARAVASGWVAQGPRVAELENGIAEATGAAHGVAVTSCTTALHLALYVLGVGPGDEVVVPSLSFIATANAARYVGAMPVFADVDEVTQNLTAESVAAVLTARTRAVILVHQGGTPADIDALHALCDPLGVAVVEDAACAIGSTYRGKPIGGHSDLVAFSFHPRKVLTTGEGGMLMTAREDWAVRLRRLREHGMSVSAADRHATDRPVIEQYLEPGFNFRMTDIQAAIGLVQLSKLAAIVARRRELARCYQLAFADIPGLLTVADPPYGTTTYQSFWILLPDSFPMSRDELMAFLMARGISPRRGIMASHREPAYAGHPNIELPVTEKLTDRSLILPMFHEMTAGEQQQVIDAIREAAGV